MKEGNPWHIFLQEDVFGKAGKKELRYNHMNPMYETYISIHFHNNVGKWTEFRC